ncbi:KH domain-containing, RNA-binding, signal transduction-associated protein 3-like isoform X3 [Diachasmimorpha longicaudata]|uniref:KH domain-containing, RNA-binding, signal transduction-associated protein 3-like isoform X3 n=1 Tax=Diachasmimorpha longicaudata TaxID=58733 RepID=UPI0030B8D6E8
MTDKSSNGDYKYQMDDEGGGAGSGGEDQPRIPLEKDRDEKDHQTDKVGEYMRELLAEKLALDPQKWPNALRLIDQEIQKTQAIGKPIRDPKYVDIYREKPIRVSVKVLVPVREHPKFNFVGKLLGPKGNSMKRLQEETMCKMAVLGRGSMKDRQKEEECRQSLDPKYAHLADDLHVEIAALAPPAEAHARIAFALAEVRKYLIPDNNDNIRQEQMREMELSMSDDPGSSDERRPSSRSAGILRPSSRPAPPRSSRAMLPPPSSRGPITRPVPAKTKVFSILDRARVAMDQSYGLSGDRYEDPAPHPPPSRSHHDYDYHGSSSSSSRYDRHYSPPSSAYRDDVYSSSRYSTYDYDDDPPPHSSHDYYDSSDYPEESSGRAWKSYKTTTTSGSASRYRSAPYTRPSKKRRLHGSSKTHNRSVSSDKETAKYCLEYD